MMHLFASYAPVVGLVFFFTVFVGIAVSVLRPSVKKQIESFGEIPLQEDHHG